MAKLAVNQAATPAPGIGAGVPVLAFDVGGTTIKSAYVDEAGGLHGITRTPSPAKGPDAPAQILAIVKHKLTEYQKDQVIRGEPQAIGIGIPGIFDDDKGIGRYSENLGWQDVDFAAKAAQLFDLPVGFIHDVRAAGLAEMRVGAGQGAQNAAVITLGTGIAAALFLDGKPYAAGGLAGEIGHGIAVPHGEACTCGNLGCLEAMASAAAIARRYAKASGRDVAGAREVLEAAASGDTIAQAVWDSAVAALAAAIAQITGLLAPDRIILGGGLAEAGATLLTPLQAQVAGLLRVSAPPQLVQATAGENAGLLGAALRARQVAAGGAA